MSKPAFWPTGMKVRVHPLFLLLLLASLGAGMIVETLVLFTIVIVHELGHVFVATSYGYKIREMQILPYGGVAKLEHGAMGWNPRHEVAIAIAGPLNNLLMILVGVLLHAAGWWSDGLTQFFIKGNLMIGFFNLLPALPLDGGRILRAATSGTRGFRAATEVSIRMSFGIAVLLILFGLLSLWAGYPNLAFLMLGAFLLFSAWELRKGMRVDMIRFLDAKRRGVPRRAQEVRTLAVPDTMQVREVIEQFAPDAYHMIYVLDERKKVQTVLEEEDLVHSVFEENGMRLTLRQLLDGGRKGNDNRLSKM
ncbi:M50 family metallopeptidase [Tumebacillus permanentifrigoris]|jgi:stage IV sporulation protein FB|nr:M50 family metallopeptidase [Tumebacillus permanentifrigoris]